MNPNKRPPPSSAGAFEGGDGLRDATKRARDFPDGKILRPGQEQPGNVLLVRVTDIVHPVTILALQQIFSRFGKVDKIVMFDKGSGFQALVQMSDVYSAMAAHEAADMQEMYSGCNLIRVGYSNLQNVTVKANTERSWDFNVGPPLEGASAPGTSPSLTGASGGGGGAGAGGGSGGGAAGSHHGSSTPLNLGHGKAPPSNPQQQPPQQGYAAPQQQYSPYSAAQQHKQQQQQQQQPYAPPPHHYNPSHQQAYGTPQQSGYHSQAPYNNGAAGPYAQAPPGVNSMSAGGGSGSYVPQTYGQGYGAAYGQGPPQPFPQQPYNPPPYGQSYTHMSAHSEDGSGSNGGAGRGGGGGGGGAGSGGGGGATGAGAGAGNGGYSRPSPQPQGGYYPPSPNMMPPQGGPYGNMQYSERGPGAYGGGSMGMSMGRPMHSGRPAQGGEGGGLGVGGPGGGGGGGQGGRAGYGIGGGRGNGLLQSPMHRQLPTPSYDNGHGHANRPPMRLRTIDLPLGLGSTAPGGATKPRPYMPLLDPLHIQALSATSVGVKKPAGRRAPGGDVELEAGTGKVKKSEKGVCREEAQESVAEEGKGDKGDGTKRANKREAAEMLGPNAADQLAVATAKVRVSDHQTDEDGESKRANKREAAEMLGADAADQLAAATAKVRVSDDGEDEASVTLSADVQIGQGAAVSEPSPRDDGGDSSVSSKENSESKVSGELRGARGKSRISSSKQRGKGGENRCKGGGGFPAEEGGTVDESAIRDRKSDNAAGQKKGTKAGGGNHVNVGGRKTGGTVFLERTEKSGSGGKGRVISQEGARRSGSDIIGQGRAQRDEAQEGNSRRRYMCGEKSQIEEEEKEKEKEDVGNGENKDRPASVEGQALDSKSSASEVSRPCGRSEVHGTAEDSVGETVDAERGVGEENETGDKVEAQDDEDDAGGDGEADRVDVGAWVAAASAERSPILMVRHVDAREVSPGALCQLFGLYGDVLKVKLVSSRGMALVEMRYAIQAINAQRHLDQAPLCGMVLEVKTSSQWTINDPTATDFKEYKGVHRYEAVSCPEDSRYREALAPPCPILVVDNVSPDVSCEELTSIFAKYGSVSSVDLDTHAGGSLGATAQPLGGGARGSAEAKSSVQALVHMEEDWRLGAKEAAVHALIMTHNLTLRERRLRVSFFNGDRHVEK